MAVVGDHPHSLVRCPLPNTTTTNNNNSTISISINHKGSSRMLSSVLSHQTNPLLFFCNIPTKLGGSITIRMRLPRKGQ